MDDLMDEFESMDVSNKENMHSGGETYAAVVGSLKRGCSENVAAVPRDYNQILPIVESTPTKTSNRIVNVNSAQIVEVPNDSSLISSSQQTAIYNLISKLFGLNIKSGGASKQSLATNKDTADMPNRSLGSANSISSFDLIHTHSMSAVDVEETLRLLLDKLLQIIDIQFLEQTLEYMSLKDSVENYQHLYTCSGRGVNLWSGVGSEESLSSLSSASSSSSTSSTHSSCSSLSFGGLSSYTLPAPSNSLASSWIQEQPGGTLKRQDVHQGGGRQCNLRSGFNKAISPCLLHFRPQLSSLVPSHAVLKHDQKQSLINMVLVNCRENNLIPNKLSELCSAVDVFVASALDKGSEADLSKAMEAVFLFTALLHTDCRQRLFDLVNFFNYLKETEPDLLIYTLGFTASLAPLAQLKWDAGELGSVENGTRGSGVAGGLSTSALLRKSSTSQPSILDEFALCFISSGVSDGGRVSCRALLQLLVDQASRIFDGCYCCCGCYCSSHYNVQSLLPSTSEDSALTLTKEQQQKRKQQKRRLLKRSTFSNRISMQQYLDQKQHNTTDELMSLLHFILGDKSTLTTRQKDKLINAMQSKHPEVYGLYLSRRRCHHNSNKQTVPVSASQLNCAAAE